MDILDERQLFLSLPLFTKRVSLLDVFHRWESKAAGQEEDAKCKVTVRSSRPSSGTGFDSLLDQL